MVIRGKSRGEADGKTLEALILQGCGVMVEWT
jgi:hypothetical protein